MNKAASGLLAAVATFAMAGAAQAQLVPNLTPFSVEVRAGAAFPKGEGTEGVNTGYTVGADLGVNVLPMVSLYGGYSRSTFGIEEGGEDGDITISGFDVGARVEIPTPLLPIDPWIKGGAVFHKVDIDGEDASERETGWEVGAGVGFGLIPKVTLSPSVTYTKIGGDLDIEHVRAEVALRVRI
jgi:opacity protein-like surface antigen